MEISYQKEIIRILNKKLIKFNFVYNLSSSATSKEFIHYIKPILPENEFNNSILHMGVNDVLKLVFNIETVSKDIVNIANDCKKFGVKQIIISGLTLFTWLNVRIFTSLKIT